MIYIDISAHWCGPCMDEIPHSKELRERLTKTGKGESVVFVVLWMESSLDGVLAVATRHGIEEESYFFTPDAARLTRGNYGFSGFPGYILMDTEGCLVNLNALRPSAPAVENQIGQLLR